MTWMTKVPDNPKLPPNRTSHFVIDGERSICSTITWNDGPALSPFKSTFKDRHPDAHLCRMCRMALSQQMHPAAKERCTCGLCRVKPGTLVGAQRTPQDRGTTK